MQGKTGGREEEKKSKLLPYILICPYISIQWSKAIGLKRAVLITMENKGDKINLTVMIDKG